MVTLSFPLVLGDLDSKMEIGQITPPPKKKIFQKVSDKPFRFLCLFRLSDSQGGPDLLSSKGDVNSGK